MGSEQIAVERGAGTVLALGLIAASVAALSWVCVTVAIGSKQLEAQALADRIALVADDALRGKGTGAPCDIARQVSEANSAELDSCRIVEQKVSIKLHIYIDFSFSAKTATLSLQASAAAEPGRQ
jgi:secretion/DNA translocation related TadE-like protein